MVYDEPYLVPDEFLVLTDAPIQKVRNTLINRGFRQDSIATYNFLKGITLEALEIDENEFNLEGYIVKLSSEPNYLEDPKVYVSGDPGMSIMEPDINNPLDDSLEFEDYELLIKNELKGLQNSLENEGYKTYFVGVNEAGFLSLTK